MDLKEVIKAAPYQISSHGQAVNFQARTEKDIGSAAQLVESSLIVERIVLFLRIRASRRVAAFTVEECCKHKGVLQCHLI